MKLEFIDLRLRNFKSFRGSHNFSFVGPTYGLFFLTGVNLDDENLGANAVGKSSLFDALCWVLYGKTALGLRGDNVVNWIEKSKCQVSCSFSIEGKSYVVRRKRDPNILEIKTNGSYQGIDQQNLETLIGYSFELFQYAVLNSQFGAAFFDLSPTDKLAVFTELMDLNFWVHCSNMAASRAKETEQDLQNLNLKISNLNGKKYELLQVKEGCESQLRVLSQKCEEEKLVVENTIQALERKLKETQANQKSYNQKMQKLKNQVLILLDKADIKETEIEDKQKKLIKLSWQRDSYSLKVDLLEKDRDLLIDTTICPVCKQVVTEQHVENVLDQLDKECSVLYGHIEKIGILEDTKREILQVLQRDFSTFSNELTLVLKEQGTIENILNRLQNEDLFLENDLKVKRRELDKLDQNVELESIKSMLQKADVDHKKVNHKLKELARNNKQLAIKKDAFSFWQKSFKEIRLLVTEQALKHLEAEVNSYLTKFGMHNWLVRFEIEKQTKIGTISRGLQTFVLTDLVQEPVPWHCFSGGELQRLKLSGSLALMDFIQSIKQLSTNLEIWDEPTAHLSQEGIDDVLGILNERAIVSKKYIWLVDHHSLARGDFVDTVVITKQDMTSHIS